MAAYPSPRDKEDDYTRRDAAGLRQAFLREHATRDAELRARLELLGIAVPGGLSPATSSSLLGAAQVPIARRRPVSCWSTAQHAGEFYVAAGDAPGDARAAVYNRRAMKLLSARRRRQDHGDRRPHAAGAVLPGRQRAGAVRPAAPPRQAAAATTSRTALMSRSRRLGEPDAVTRFAARLRDVAGQNLTGKATQGRHWTSRAPDRDTSLELRDRQEGSQINILQTRGKRVVAEATIPDSPLREGRARAASCCSARARVAPNLRGVRRRRNNPNGATLRERDHRDLRRHRRRATPANIGHVPVRRGSSTPSTRLPSSTTSATSSATSPATPATRSAVGIGEA